VMPFVKTNTIQDLDDNTLKIMANTYGGIFLNNYVVDALYLSAVNRKLYLNILKDCTPGHKLLSLSDFFELSDQYVVKMAELCDSRGVNFHMYPCPVSETQKVDKFENLQEPFRNSKTYNINPRFLDMVLIYPAEQAADSVHFSGDYANQAEYNKKMNYMYSGELILEYLKFE